MKLLSHFEANNCLTAVSLTTSLKGNLKNMSIFAGNSELMLNEITVQSLTNLTQINPAILLYFYSNQCAPCISLRPKVEELLSGEFPKMKLQLIDSQNYPEVTASFGVFTFPTLVIFFEGKEFQRYSKYVSLSQLNEAISRPYNLLFEV
jgi:thioredoxin-like negative regulator of GroEL